MTTNTGANIKADASSRNTESNQNDDNTATTTSVLNQMGRSASLAALDCGNTGWEISKPTTEDVDINRDPRAIHADNNEALFLPPNRASSSEAKTPLQSNARKKQNDPEFEDTKTGNDNGHKSNIISKGSNDTKIGTNFSDLNREKSSFERRLLKSVSFENHNRIAKQDTILDEHNNSKDGDYGHYLDTSNHKSISLDKNTANSNTIINTGYVNDDWKATRKEELCQKQDSYAALCIPELSTIKQKN